MPGLAPAYPRQFASCRAPVRHPRVHAGTRLPSRIEVGSFVVGVVLNIENGKRDAASIKDLIDLTASDMGRVNELILSKAGSNVEMIPQIANHLISSGG